MEKEVKFRWEGLEEREIDILFARKLSRYNRMSERLEGMISVLDEINEVLEKIKLAQEFGVEINVAVTGKLSEKIIFEFTDYFIEIIVPRDLKEIVDDYIKSELAMSEGLDYFHEDGFEYLSAIYEYLYSQKEAQIAYLDEANDYLMVIENGS